MTEGTAVPFAFGACVISCLGMSAFWHDHEFMKTTLRLAIPLMFQQLVSVSVNLVDNLMIGWLGDAAISGVAAVSRYYMIAMFGINGLAAAGSVFIAQFYGAGKEQQMQETFRTMLVYALGAMALFTVLALCLADPILRFFTSEAEVIAQGRAYVHISAWSFLPAAVTICIYNAMRSIGETGIPLRTSVLAVGVNCVLNYVFMFGRLGFPALAIRGAALATLCARLLEMALALRALQKNSFPFATRISHLFHISSEVRRRVLSKAAPLVTNEILWSAGMAVLFKFYATRGGEVMSGYSVSATVSDLFYSLYGGMAAATTVLVSQNLGADRLEQARENGYKLMGFSAALAVVFGIMMYFSADLVPLLYRNLSVQSQQIAMTYLHVQAFMFWIYMEITECYFILRAGGDMKHTLMMDSGYTWAALLPVLGIVTYATDFDYLEIYLVSQVMDLIKLLFAWHQVRKEHWLVNLTAQQNADRPEQNV